MSQYPSIAPPTIVVTATYPGATAQTLDDSVTSLIEQEMNGADGLHYVESQSQANGQAQITLTFSTDTNPDLAAVDVQNRLKRVESRLPQAVTQQGVQVNKARSNFLLFITLSSEDDKLDPIALGDYLSRNVLNEIKRVPGVGQAQLFGSERAMRIWIDPAKLVGYRLTPADVSNAIRAQNAQVASGTLGELPSARSQQIAATVVVNGQLATPEQFGAIVLRANPDGSVVRLADVARIELGGQAYATSARIDGKPISAIGVQLSPTANALGTATAVKDKMEELSKYFPPNVKFTIPYDTSTFVKISIQEVVKTLLEAIVLVFLVIFLFLQNIRYTLIPTMVVPVALMGTFATMYAFGFSINVLTMFGLVLAIGILVDDAIVVVENVERIMSEEGLSPREATKKAMGQITGALVGITLVLVSVFIPMAFFGGAVGAIYRQFTLSMVASILFSVLMAFSLTPALAATILKPIRQGEHHEKKGFYGWFNRRFASTSAGYQSFVARLLHKTGRTMLVYGLVLVVVGVLYARLPSSFLPTEDQGYIITNIQLAPGASQSRTLEVVKQVEDYFLKQPGVEHIVAVTGFSFSGNGQNAALAFVPLKNWDQRGKDDSADAIAARAFGALSSITRRDRISAEPAADPRAGQLDRLHLPPAGSRRPRPRRADRGAQPAAGTGVAEQGTGRSAAGRPGRRAAAAAGNRPRQGQRARRRLRRHQQRALDRARLVLRQRLPEPGPAAARGRAGRRPQPAAAGRPGPAVRAQRARHDGAVLDLLQLPLDPGPGAADPLQRLSGDPDLRQRRARLQHRRRDGRDGSAGGQAAGRLRLRVDRPVVGGKEFGRAGAGAVRAVADRGVPGAGGAV